MDPEGCRALVQRYYNELWDEWRVELVDEIIARDLHFRGSLGTMLDGRQDFLGYLLGIQQAMPDFHHDLEWIVAETDAAAARVVYSGTHVGDLFGVPGTGHRISYQGAAFFRMADGMMSEIWTLGDMSSVRRQLLGTPAA